MQNLETRFKNLILELNHSIDTQNIKEIKKWIKDINIMIKSLLKETKADNRIYKIMMFIDIFFSNLFKENILLIDYPEKLDIINFEKQTLLELKTILKDYKKDKQYNNLDYLLLATLQTLEIQYIRRKEFENEFTILSYAGKNVDYIPIKKESYIQIDTLKETIKENIKVLKR